MSLPIWVYKREYTGRAGMPFHSCVRFLVYISDMMDGSSNGIQKVAADAT